MECLLPDFTDRATPRSQALTIPQKACSALQGEQGVPVLRVAPDVPDEQGERDGQDAPCLAAPGQDSRR